MTTPTEETLGAFLGDTAEKIAKAERAAIVAWLRNGDIHDELACPDDLADAIESGAHHGQEATRMSIPATCGECKHWVCILHTEAGACCHPDVTVDYQNGYADSGENGRQPPACCPLRKVQP